MPLTYSRYLIHVCSVIRLPSSSVALPPGNLGGLSSPASPPRHAPSSLILLLPAAPRNPKTLPRPSSPSSPLAPQVCPSPAQELTEALSHILLPVQTEISTTRAPQVRPCTHMFFCSHVTPALKYSRHFGSMSITKEIKFLPLLAQCFSNRSFIQFAFMSCEDP